MEDAVVLYNGYIVYLSSVSDNETFEPKDANLMFFENGTVMRFKKNNTPYIAIFDSDTDEFVGYYSEKKFWENNTIKRKRTAFDDANELSANYRFNLGDRFDDTPIYWFEIPKDTRVIMAEKFVQEFVDQPPPQPKMYYHYRSERYETAKNKKLNTFFGLYELSDDHPLVSSDIYSPLINYRKFIIDKKFLSVQGDLYDLNSVNITELNDVVFVLTEIFNDASLINYLTEKKFIEPFVKHINLNNRFLPADGTIELNYHNIYNSEYFSKLRLKLIEFWYWIVNYREDYSEIDVNDLSVYIVNIFPDIELSGLSFDTKMNLLNMILKDNFWVIGDWYFNELDEEAAIIKIVRAMAREDENGTPVYSEIDAFFDELNGLYDYSENETLFEKLCSVIDDPIFFSDDGKGSLGQFIFSVYSLWIESKFNPHHDVYETAENALTYFNYTPYSAYSEAMIDHPYDVLSYIDKSAAPIQLGYESEKILLWYCDNYVFDFEDSKIVAKEKNPEYDLLPFGYYNYFQPIALKATDNLDTIIKLPVKGITDVTSSNDLEFINNCMPIFLLRYIDRVGARSNLKETIGVTLDVALTFTGIGNVTKLRHITKVSLLRKMIFNPSTVSSTNKILFWRAIGGIVGTAEIAFSTASIMHGILSSRCANKLDPYDPNPPSMPDPSDPNYQAKLDAYNEYQLCQTIDKWLFALEMASLSADLLTKRFLKRASRELASKLPPTDPSIPQSSRDYINEMADIVDEFDEFLSGLASPHPNLQGKLDNLGWINSPSEEVKAYEFMWEFKNRPAALADLDSAPHLVDRWDEIEDLIPHRKNIKFLKSYDERVSLTTLDEHFDGIADLEYVSGGSTAARLSGMHNPHNVVSYPPGSGQWSWKDGVYREQNPGPKYRIGKMVRNMADKTDNATGLPWQSQGSSLKTKKRMNVTWPDTYSTQRIKEEEAFVMANKQYERFEIIDITTGEKSLHYFGYATDGHKIHVITNQSGTPISIHPDYF